MLNGPCSLNAYIGNGQPRCMCNDCLYFFSANHAEKQNAGWQLDQSTGMYMPPVGHRLYSQYFPGQQSVKASPGGLFVTRGQYQQLHGLEAWLPEQSDIGKTTRDIAADKLPPMNCTSCNHRNEYVGREHLQNDGIYVCRQCRKDK